jgi:hypothetical protein
MLQATPCPRYRCPFTPVTPSSRLFSDEVADTPSRFHVVRCRQVYCCTIFAIISLLIRLTLRSVHGRVFASQVECASAVRCSISLRRLLRHAAAAAASARLARQRNDALLMVSIYADACAAAQLVFLPRRFTPSSPAWLTPDVRPMNYMFMRRFAAICPLSRRCFTRAAEIPTARDVGAERAARRVQIRHCLLRAAAGFTRLPSPRIFARHCS